MVEACIDIKPHASSIPLFAYENGDSLVRSAKVCKWQQMNVLQILIFKYNIKDHKLTPMSIAFNVSDQSTNLNIHLLGNFNIIVGLLSILDFKKKNVNTHLKKV